tara:strand:- start:1238 stop:2707 length:1470 start_codon:yes stop_codon:yes gene_type:complete
MAKGKSSQSSELDPAIRQMMQETFDLGKGAITETKPVLDADGNQIYDYVTGPGGTRIPIARTTTGLKEYQAYEGDRFATPTRATGIGEAMLGNYVYSKDEPFQQTARLDDLYGRMSDASDYTPQQVSSRDVTAGLIDLPSEIARTMVAEERVADPDDITAREVLERGFDIERIDAPQTIAPQTLAETSLDPYMNPYNQYVRDITINDILEGRDRSLSQLQDRAIKAGAFGGTREGVEAGLIQSKALSEIAKQSALLGQQGFNTASQLATQDLGLLNQAQRDNISNLMEAQRLNQATDLAAEQSMLDAAMEAQRLNQARDLSLGQFNTEMAQQAAITNQAANLQAQGMNQEDAFRTAQANVDNMFRTQSTNVANQLEADLANQSSSLQAAMANQNAGLEANALNQQGLLSAAGLADASNQSTVDRFNQMREIGSVQDARNQQQADFDYQQFLEGQEYQMMLAQFLGGLLQGFPTPMKSRGSERSFSTLFG